jgi:alpha-ketoglutarate-dependent taurine dioxygenase
MAFHAEPTHATLGATITGVRLAALGEADWRATLAAFHEHALLIIPEQHLSPDEQAAFARRFGEIEYIAPNRETVPISNERADGTLLADDDATMQILRGNEGWHTDSSYMPLAAKASVLSARVVPSRGGQTEWADMRAAYQALEPSLRERIASFSAYHSIRYSQARIGQTEGYAGYGFDVDRAPLRPLVKQHPVTGRPSLFIGRHAHGIPGLSPEESEKLLDELVVFACQPPRTYQHAWTPGDVVIWDNRCVLHRARPWGSRRGARHAPHTHRGRSGDRARLDLGSPQRLDPRSDQRAEQQRDLRERADQEADSALRCLGGVAAEVDRAAHDEDQAEGHGKLLAHERAEDPHGGHEDDELLGRVLMGSKHALEGRVPGRRRRRHVELPARTADQGSDDQVLDQRERDHDVDECFVVHGVSCSR